MLDQYPPIVQNIILGNSQGQEPSQILAARICVFDGDPQLRDSLAQTLQQRGYDVVTDTYGELAHAMLRDGTYDLIVLNLESSGGLAAHALKSIRLVRPEVPLIVTTAHASAESAMAAIKANVVDYIVKPYQTSDLLLTISKALAERAQQLRQQQLLAMVSQTLEALKQSGFSELTAQAQPTQTDAPVQAAATLRAGELELDRQKRQLTWNADPVRAVELTESELTIMATLMGKPNEVVSCNTLGSALGYQNMDKWTIENVIRSVVFRLRQKIETDSERTRLIHTVRGRGYYFALA